MICSAVYVSSYAPLRVATELKASIMIAFFDFNGPTNFTDTFNDEDDDFTDLTVVAGE